MEASRLQALTEALYSELVAHSNTACNKPFRALCQPMWYLPLALLPLFTI